MKNNMYIDVNPSQDEGVFSPRSRRCSLLVLGFQHPVTPDHRSTALDKVGLKPEFGCRPRSADSSPPRAVMREEETDSRCHSFPGSQPSSVRSHRQHISPHSSPLVGAKQIVKGRQTAVTASQQALIHRRSFSRSFVISQPHAPHRRASVDLPELSPFERTRSEEWRPNSAKAGVSAETFYKTQRTIRRNSLLSRGGSNRSISSADGQKAAQEPFPSSKKLPKGDRYVIFRSLSAVDSLDLVMATGLLFLLIVTVLGLTIHLPARAPVPAPGLVVQVPARAPAPAPFTFIEEPSICSSCLSSPHCQLDVAQHKAQL